VRFYKAIDLKPNYTLAHDKKGLARFKNGESKTGVSLFKGPAPARRTMRRTVCHVRGYEKVGDLTIAILSS